MKAQSRNRLGYLLSNEPCWPDPTESIGDFIKLIDGKKSCWKAKGRAREAFDVLADEIKTYLDKNVDSIPGSDWITWSIYMIGKTPQRAAPVVMFFCEEPRTRRRVQDVIKKSGILERYPGVKSGNAALPPDLDQLEPLASDAVSHTDTANTEGSDLKFTISVSRNSEVFVTGHHGDTSSTRLATLGGLVQHKGDVYGFTAGHPLDKSTTSYPPIELKAIDEEWEIDSDSDSDSDTEVDMYDKESMEAMNRASVTPVDARSATSSWSDDGSSDTDSTRSLQSSDSSAPIEDRSFCQPSQTQAASGQVVRNSASRDRNPAMDVHKFERNAKAVPASAVAEGRLAVLSTNLDYALIKFEDSSLLAVKDSVGNKTATNPLRPTHVIKTGPRDAEIITYTASGGLMTGTLHGTPSYTRLENSKTFQKVYTVRFNGVLAKGDCGSWVIDAETHGLYGHIIAGCERTRIAYIMAAHSVFEDAKERLGGELLLECDSASEAISPTDAAKTTEAALLEEVLDSSFRDPQGDHEQFNTKAEDWNFDGQSPSSVTKRESEQSTAIARERKQDTLVSTPQVWRECSQELIRPSDLTRPAQSLPLKSLEEKPKHHQDSLRDFVLYPHQQQQSEMLAFESRHQQHYNPHFDMDAGLHQPYPDLTFNHVNSFELNSSYSTSYDMPSFAVSAPPPDMIKADHFHQPTPSASLPPTLSNASVLSVPSAASSAVGSPYSGNHGVPYTDGWTNVHGLGLMNNNGMVQDLCFTTGMESEMVFAPDHKLTSFVGECADISSVKLNSIPFSAASTSHSFVSPSIAISTTLDPDVTIDTILEQAESAVTTPKLASSPVSSRRSSSSPISAVGVNTLRRMSKDHGQFRSPTTPASTIPQPFDTTSSIQYSPAVTHRRGSLHNSVTGAGITKARAAPPFSPKKSFTSMPSSPQPESPKRAYATQIHSSFFAQPSGNFMPPLESSC
jgi:hypothetical protein